MTHPTIDQRNGAPDNRSLPAIKAALLPHAETLATRFFGPPTQNSASHVLRFGTKGSKKVDLTNGDFYDHEAGQGGSLIDMIRVAENCSFGDAVDWAINWLGGKAIPVRPMEKPRLTRKSKDVMRRKALAIWTAARPARSPLIHNYFDKRGLRLAELGESRQLLRPPLGPAVVFPIRQANGTINACHLIQLNEDGTKKRKQIRGPMKGEGGFIVLRRRPSRPLFVCEGLENCASMARFYPNASHACVLALANLKELDLRTTPSRIFVVDDGDGDKQPAGEYRQRQVEHVARLGTPVGILRLPENQDANDMLRQYGAIRARYMIQTDNPAIEEPSSFMGPNGARSGRRR